jgi:hypothetical protein
MQQSSNVKLFGAQSRRETAKLQQFLELMKATFECGRNTTQRSECVRRHEGNSLDPRRTISWNWWCSLQVFFKRDARLDCLWVMILFMHKGQNFWHLNCILVFPQLSSFNCSIAQWIKPRLVFYLWPLLIWVNLCYFIKGLFAPINVFQCFIQFSLWV